MKSILQALAGIIKIILIAIKGDQPKKEEIEQSTNELWSMDKYLQERLKEKIKEKENEKNK